MGERSEYGVMERLAAVEAVLQDDGEPLFGGSRVVERLDQFHRNIFYRFVRICGVFQDRSESLDLTIARQRETTLTP